MKRIILISVIMLMINAFTSDLNAASSSPIKWKMQTTSPSGSIMVDNFTQVFADLVEERSKGRLIIKVYPASAIVSPLEVTSAVGKGVVEMGQGGPVYDIGNIPLANMGAGLPFAWATPEDQYDFWNIYKGGKALEMLNEAYHEKGVHNIILVTHNDEYVALTNFPVNTLEDWKGRKMRTTGVYSKVMAALGASTVNLSLPEIYMGIQTGTIDGAVVGLSLLEEFKLKEVIHYIIMPPFSSCVGTTLYVNLNKWNSLPADLKEIVNKAAKDAYAGSMLPYSIELRAKTLDEAINKNKIKMITLSDKEEERLRGAVAPVWDYVGRMTPANENLMTLLKEYLDSKGTQYPGK